MTQNKRINSADNYQHAAAVRKPDGDGFNRLDSKLSEEEIANFSLLFSPALGEGLSEEDRASFSETVNLLSERLAKEADNNAASLVTIQNLQDYIAKLKRQLKEYSAELDDKTSKLSLEKEKNADLKSVIQDLEYKFKSVEEELRNGKQAFEHKHRLEQQFFAPRILLPQLLKAMTVRSIEITAGISPIPQWRQKLADTADRLRSEGGDSQKNQSTVFVEEITLPETPEAHEAGPARYDRTFFVNYTFGGKTRYLPRSDLLLHTTRAGRALFGLKDKFRGERCFVIGNGPSLNKQNLFQLKNEFTIGSNYIYMNYKKMGFYPSILSFANFLVIEQRRDEILALHEPIKALPFYLFNDIGAPERSMMLNMQHQTPEFSLEASNFVSTQSTITYVNLQLAYHLGFDSVYLIGVDNRYKQPKRGTEGTVLTQDEDDPNHFSPNYFKGLKWQKADEEKMESLYARAKIAFEKRGSRIIDCTYDGALTLFEKRDLESVVSGSLPPSRKLVDEAKSKLRAISEKPSALEPKQVVVTVSPDLTDRFGHHFNMDRHLYLEAQRRGDALVSICSGQLEQKLTDECNWLIPAITTKTWWSLRDQGVIERKANEFRIGVRKALKVIDLAYGEHTPKTIYMYTGNLPLARALCDELAGRKKIQAVVQFFYGAMLDLNDPEILAETKRSISVLLASGVRLCLGTTSLVDHFEDKTGYRLEHLPGDPSCTFSDADVSSMMFRDRNGPKKAAKERFRVFFTPNMNLEKGYLTAVEAALHIAENPSLSAKIEPVVRYIPRCDTKTEALEAGEKVRRNPWVSIAEGILDDEEFRSLFLDSDIIVIPYTVKAFRHRMVNSFTDALYSGKPMIGARGTYIGDQIKAYGCGQTFEDGSAKDLIRALIEVVNNYDHYLIKIGAARFDYFEGRSWKTMYNRITTNN